MRKTLSAILIAALLALTVVCALAVQAEDADTDDSAVVYNFLAALTEADGSYYTLKTNNDGSVTLTLKQAASQDAPIVIMESFTDNEFDASTQVYLAADIVCDNPEIDFRLHYTRNDKLADQYWTGMREDTNSAYATKTDTSVIWNVTKYLTDNGKLNADNKHKYTDLMITDCKEGDVITFNTLALISDPEALVPGTPLVGGAAEENTTTSDETSPEETTSEPSTSSESSTSSASSVSSAPVTAGDTGVILYVVLAVLAAIGAIAMVKLRHE